MRIYQNFREAFPEIKRDLAEMGIKVHPATYQDKDVHDNPDFETLELQNYIYTVIHPDVDLVDATQPWADSEWYERRSGIETHPVNPGKAWELRSDVWKEFLMPEGKFAYTYSERFSVNAQVARIATRLKNDPDSRQAFISVWDVHDTAFLGGISRVPCTLGYLLQCRRDRLNITYLQRSADFITHFTNDVWMALKLQEYVSETIMVEIGTFTHWIGSLHIFQKDTEGVF